MPLSRRAIKLYIGNVFYQRALTMFKKGAVLEVGFDAEKGVVSGEVQGSQEDPYQVSFKLDADGKIMHSKCSCPMRRDCKHVATLALAYVREEGGGDEEEGGNVQKTVQEKIPLGVPNLLIRLTRDTPKRILLRATWRYGKELVPLNAKARRVISPSGTVLRNTPEEVLLSAELGTFTDEESRSVVMDLWREGQTSLTLAQAAEWMKQVLPGLERTPGVVVERAHDVPRFVELTDSPALIIEKIPAASKTDWLDLALKLTIGKEVVTVAEVLLALGRGDTKLFLANGHYLSLKGEFFNKLRGLLAESADVPDPISGKVSVSRFQQSWFQELQALGVVNKELETWAKTLQTIADPDMSRFTVPASLQADLRPYQREGFAWLCWLFEQQLGGILADDMGLGKTVQTIAFLLYIQKSLTAPVLIIAPTSVVENWDAELHKFAPSIQRVVLRRGDRTELLEKIQNGSVVVTSYALLRRDHAALLTHAWSAVILDEAQHVKNYQGQAYKLIRELRTMSRFALTGTPLENNLMELWTMLSLSCPGLFPDPEHFRQFFKKPIENGTNPERLAIIRKRMKPFLKRRTKELVGKDLPPKTEQVLLLEMESNQRKQYDLFLHKERQRVLGLLAEGGLQEHRFQVLTSLLRLRQLCLHPRLITATDTTTPAIKIDELMEQLEEVVAEGHKTIIFSQFTSFLELVKQALAAKKWRYSYLDGATADRRAAIDEFQKNADVPLFLLSLKAGGVGLNLTAADYCIILDPWWNPAVEDQAIARAHRMGQTRPVMVYKYIVKDTIEEKILKLQEKKRQLFKNVIDEGELFGQGITEEDIREIFG
jgi:superfamily II DNA or RNA helicase